MAFLTTDSEIVSLLRRSRTIAVVGLSANPARDSHRVAQYLLSRGYTVFPVNPTLTGVLGLKAFPDIAAIGHPVDIVDVFRRPEHLGQIVEDAIAIGARAVWGQFGVVDAAAAERAQAAGLMVVMDRCIKVEHHRLGMPRHVA